MNINKSIISFSAIVLSMVVSLFVLNRWVVTPLGAESFGKLWFFYLSYDDFGFVRRGLIGSVTNLLGLHRLFSNPYTLGFVLHGASLIGLYAILIRYVYPRLIADSLLVSVVFLSPAFFFHLAYATGTLDTFVLLLVLPLLLYPMSNALAALLFVVAMLVHEVALFFLPAIIFAQYFLHRKTNCSLKAADWGCLLIMLGACYFVPKLTVSMGQIEFETLMSSKLSIASYRHVYWSGFFEVSSSVSDNYQIDSGTINRYKANLFQMIFPVLYLIFLARLVLKGTKFGTVGSIFLLFVILFPLTALLVAGDFYRWLCFSAITALVFIVVFSKLDFVNLKWRDFIPLLLCCLFGPIGAGDLSRPFPILQFFLDRIS